MGSHYLKHDAKMLGKDLAIRTAEATGATYVLAQDPDAVRFSAAERKCGDLVRLPDLSRLITCGVF
jgi:hypothetical protein